MLMIATYSDSVKKEKKEEKKKRFEDNHEYGFVLKDFTNGRNFYNVCKQFSRAHGVSVNDFEDIFQETILKSELEEEYDHNHGEEWPYYFTIFRNTFIDFIRKRDKERSINSTSLEGRNLDLDNLLEKNGCYHNKNPIEILKSRESSEEAAEIVFPNIRKLKSIHYLSLFGFLSGKSYEQISEEENILMGTVKSRIHQAKRYLKEIIESEAITKGFNIEEILF